MEESAPMLFGDEQKPDDSLKVSIQNHDSAKLTEQTTSADDLMKESKPVQMRQFEVNINNIVAP